MMRTHIRLMLAATALCFAPAVSDAQEVSRADVGRAIIAMNKRIRTAVGAQAKRLELGTEWVEYCALETARKLASHPKDGSVPFGSDPFTALNMKPLLDEALDQKEVYLRQDQILCLSSVRRTLEGGNSVQP
ncbi:hypothetical protein ACQKQD_05005 [Methylobacterium sp. NPDC080182]|uniref:hypothetical protein n=1 Tax=Methylobacterium sp. NPDC080182 TaxID=3390590 RepID=UPI003D03930F